MKFKALTVLLAQLGTACFGQVMPTPTWLATETTVTSPHAKATRLSDQETTPTQPVPSGEPTTSSQSSLTPEEVERILSKAEEASSRTVSFLGFRTLPHKKRPCRHHIFVVDRNGKVLGRRSMPDAWTGCVDIALGKARTAAFFSSDENALTSRQIGDLAAPHGPDGKGPPGPLIGIGNTNRGTGERAKEIEQNCIVTFPGGVPLYKNGKLVGAIGTSGDGVNQDESVAYAGAEGFLPSADVGSPTPLRPKAVDWFPPR